MRLTIRHETIYAYEKAARRAIEVLRLTPRGHNGQFVVNWRIDVDKDCRLQRSVDPFGNTLNSFTVEGPISGLSIVAAGSVEERQRWALDIKEERFEELVRDRTFLLRLLGVNHSGEEMAG